MSKVLESNIQEKIVVKFKWYDKEHFGYVFKIGEQVIEKPVKEHKMYATIVYDESKGEYKVTGMQKTYHAGGKHYNKQYEKYNQVAWILL